MTTPFEARATALMDALDAMVATDEDFWDSPAYEAVHRLYETHTGFCHGDERDPRTYTNAQGWTNGVSCWEDAAERETLLANGYDYWMANRFEEAA